MSKSNNKPEAKESQTDREIRELIETEEGMLSEALDVEEPDWRKYLPDEARDSPGLKQRKLQEFMEEFILWRCGLWSPPNEEDVPSETIQARRLALARRTKAARS